MKEYLRYLVHEGVKALEENQLKERLKKSVQQSKEGKVKSRGSFAKYVEDEIWTGFHRKCRRPNGRARLEIIDETVWETHLGLSVKDAQPLDKRINIPVLKSLFASL